MISASLAKLYWAKLILILSSSNSTGLKSYPGLVL